MQNNFFYFTKPQKQGLLLLISVIVCMQFFIFWSKNSSEKIQIPDSEWLAFQSQIDSLKNEKPKESYTIYPFNPNFITDFKAYKLGLSTAEFNRLTEFRKSNQYVNSPQDFQKITKISNNLLAKISPYFKFPDWVTEKNKNNSNSENQFTNFTKNERKIVVKDINLATKEDLMNIYGIGDAISDRILKQKETFGAFVNINQMEDIWGLSPEVIAELKKYFKIQGNPIVKKININTISSKELSKFPYFKYALAREIVTYRSMNDGIQSVNDLTKINGFPIDKIEIIRLYLEF